MATVSDPRFETQDNRFDTEYRESDVPPAKRSKWSTCLVGCLVMLGVALVLFAVVAFWVGRNWRGWASSAAEQVIGQGIDASDLPAQEKLEMKAEVQRVTVAYREGRLSNEQLARIMQDVANSPLMSLFVVLAVDKQYFDKSNLSDEEKAEGRIALRRFVRGAVDGEIGNQSVDAVFAHIADRQPNGNWELRQQVSDEDLRAALAEAKQAADDADIPEQPEEVDPSEEFKRIIDEGMGVGDAVGPPG